MKGNVKKNQKTQLFPDDEYVFKIFFPIFVSKIVNFSVGDGQPAPEGWLVIPFNFLRIFNSVFKFHLFGEAIKIR